MSLSDGTYPRNVAGKKDVDRSSPAPAAADWEALEILKTVLPASEYDRTECEWRNGLRG
jgi:hypothetical protein